MRSLDGNTPNLSWLCRVRVAAPRKSLRPKDVSNSPASGVVFSGNRALGQRVEQGGLADVGQADDAAFEAHGCWLSRMRPAGCHGPHGAARLAGNAMGAHAGKARIVESGRGVRCLAPGVPPPAPWDAPETARWAGDPFAAASHPTVRPGAAHHAAHAACPPQPQCRAGPSLHP